MVGTRNVSLVVQSRSMVVRMTVIGLVQPEMGLPDHGDAITGIPDVPRVARPVAISITTSTVSRLQV